MRTPQQRRDAAQRSIWVFYKVDNMISEIEKNFYRITLRMPYRLKHVNAYLFAHDKELALFDTGLNMPGSYEMLEKDLTGAGFSINDIRHIFLTHVHTDHCSMAGLLQKNTGAKIYLSATAFKEYQHFRQTDPAVQQLKKFYARQGMPSHLIDLVIEEYEDIRGIIAEFNTDNFLLNNESREFGDWNFEVIFTPGHAAGHVCFFFRKEGFLLAGDHILPYIAPILSPDIFDDNFRPLSTYLDSLNIIENLPIATVYPGHGSYFVDLKERLEDIRLHHKKKKAIVLDRLSEQPQTTYTVSDEMTDATLSDFDKFLALNETLTYFKELKAEGAIKEEMINNVLVYTTI
ncbi:MAG: MBL fold metallo-hydrolase [Smithella sp.]|jgi:glyoxylase-like metal-dependent hydrolase (beta-lactamase superfamily II)